MESLQKQAPRAEARSRSYEALDAETARVRVWSRLSSLAGGLLLLCYIADFLGNRFLGEEHWTLTTSETGLVVLLVIGWSVCITILALSYLLPGRRKRRMVVRELASDSDLADFPKLVQAAKLEDGQCSMLAERALRELIPRIGQSHASLIDDKCRRYLRGKLKFPQEGFLYRDLLQLARPVAKAKIETEKQDCIDAIRAFAALGDREAIDRVYNLSVAIPVTRAGREIRKVAVQYFPLLRARAGEEDARYLLLRPGAIEASDHLLRPQIAGSAESSEALLRVAPRKGLDDEKTEMDVSDFSVTHVHSPENERFGAADGI